MKTGVIKLTESEWGDIWQRRKKLHIDKAAPEDLKAGKTFRFDVYVNNSYAGYFITDSCMYVSADSLSVKPLVYSLCLASCMSEEAFIDITGDTGGYVWRIRECGDLPCITKGGPVSGRWEVYES